ncbi:MAG: LysR family transcriptional regulator [Blautia sp.]
MENLTLYKIFHTVAKTGNISKAAKELYISQPAISKSIQKLETQLHTILFKRSSRGVSLTQEGKLLSQYVDNAFSSLQAGEELLSHNRSLGISQLRIGVSTTLCKYILLPHLQNYIQKYPHVKLTITCQPTYQTLNLLEENKIDLGLVGKTQNLKNLYFQPFHSVQDTFVATRQYLDNLSLRSETANLFSSATFMMLDEENITRQSVNRTLQDRGITLKNVLEITTMDLLIEFAKIGLGIACVIREFVQEELAQGLLQEVDLGLKFPKRTVGFACKKTDQNLPVIHNFLLELTSASTMTISK